MLTYPFTITNARLAEIACDLMPEFADIYAASDDQTDDPILDVFLEYDGFDSCTAALREHFNLLGFSYDADTQTYTVRDADTLKAVSAITSAITTEYDSEGPSPTWEQFGLRGDDDVDYNSSYFAPVLDVLLLLEAKEA